MLEQVVHWGLLQHRSLIPDDGTGRGSDAEIVFHFGDTFGMGRDGSGASQI